MSKQYEYKVNDEEGCYFQGTFRTSEKNNKVKTKKPFTIPYDPKSKGNPEMIPSYLTPDNKAAKKALKNGPAAVPANTVNASDQLAEAVVNVAKATAAAVEAAAAVSDAATPEEAADAAAAAEEAAADAEQALADAQALSDKEDAAADAQDGDEDGDDEDDEDDEVEVNATDGAIELAAINEIDVMSVPTDDDDGRVSKTDVQEYLDSLNEGGDSI